MRLPKDPTNTETSFPKVSSMAIIGHTTATTSKIWARLYCGGKWWLVVTPRPLTGDLDTLDGKSVEDFLRDTGISYTSIQCATIGSETDNTHTFEVTGLRGDTQYYYAIIADHSHKDSIPRRTEIGHQRTKSFRTLPNSSNRICFGYYSCHNPFSRPGGGEGAWPHYFEAMRDNRGMFSIGGGDQIYVDSNGSSDLEDIWQWLGQYKNDIVKSFGGAKNLDTDGVVDYFTKIYRQYYRLYWNFNSLRKVYESFPQYMIWDDHEIMDGWGSYTRKERRGLLRRWFEIQEDNTNDLLVDLMFQAAKKVYFEYQHQHNPTTAVDLTPENNRECQWDYSIDADTVQVYTLDVRGHHDYERHKNGTALLGNLQMDRMAAWLKSAKVSSAKAIFIVSPVPVVHWGPFFSSMDFGETKDDLRDEWEHESNTLERNKLLDMLLSFSQDAECKVVILSGDVHCASVYRIEQNDAYPKAQLFNATSSAIARSPAPALAEHFIKKSGAIARYPGGRAHRLFALSGKCNFMMVSSDVQDGKAQVRLDFHWVEDHKREVKVQKILL